MNVNSLVCNKCGDRIFSRARHDFRWCSCKSIFVDGGFEYFKFGWTNLEDFIREEFEINNTKEELYTDWRLEEDKFGLIKKHDYSRADK